MSAANDQEKREELDRRNHQQNEDSERGLEMKGGAG